MTTNYCILIIEDNVDDYELCQRHITNTNAIDNSKVHFQVAHAKNGKLGLEKTVALKPDCILLDYSLPGSDGLSVLKEIKKHNPLLPVIVLTGQGSEQLAVSLLKAGAQDYVVKAEIHNYNLKQNIINAILANKKNGFESSKINRTNKTTILIVDDNQDDRELIQRYLKKIRNSVYHFVEASSGIGLFKLIDQYSPQCLLLDYSLPGENGLQILSKVINYYPFIPVIILSGQGNEHIAAEAIKRGAFHYLLKDELSSEILDATIKQSIDKKYLEKVVYEKNQEIKQYQYKSLERKNRFDRVIKATGIIVWEYDTRKNTLFIAEQIASLLGEPLAEKYLSIQEWRGYIHPEDLPEFDNHWYLGIANIKNEYYLAYRIRHKNGRYLWIRETGNVLSRKDNGEPLEITGLYENINERRKDDEILNRFFTLTLESDQPLAEKIQSVIRLGVEYLELDVGVVSQVTQNVYEVKYCQPQQLLTKEKTFKFKNTYCSHLFGQQEIKSWHHITDEKMTTHLCYKNQSIKSYIGTTIFINKQPYGTINFFGKSPSTKPFSNQNKVLLRLMAQWLSSELTRSAILRDVKESQNFLQLVQDSIPDLLFVKDSAFRIVRANPAFLNLYPEDTRDTIIGTTTVESYDEQEAEAFLAQDKKALKHGNSEIEETIHFPSGETKTLLTKKVRFQNQDGESFVLGVSRDITESKNTLARLAESEERYELAVKGSAVGLWDWNIKTGTLFWSDTFKEIIGITNAEFKPSYEEFGDRLHPDDREATEIAISNHLNNKTPFNVEYRLRRNDNTYVWIHARGQAIWNEAGEPTRMAGSVDDISVSKAAEEEILRSNKELERFAYVASHDLQEPLRMVTNFTQLLKKHYEQQLDDKALEYISYAVNGATRMQDLVKDLLTYARIGNEAENLQAVNLNTIRTTVEENLLDSIHQTNTEIEWPLLPTVLATPARMSSVFQNLIGNAIKYRKPDLAPKITISVISSGSFWTFDITDNGIGMKQEYCHKIFEPFKRLHRKEEYSGTGMGLSICRKSIEELGGKIWAVSKIGQGTSIKFSLPKLELNPSEESNE
ncbi:response regulator [Marinomonas agarivorans]|nr:response regulator [Marinomonas agarivorans]